MSNNIIDFGQLGGYRLEQPTFEKMQSTYFGILAALMGHLGVPSTGSFIICGCEIIGPNITPGIMYIDGALCPFSGAVGTLSTKIKKNVTTDTLSFQNGSNPSVFTSTSAVVNSSGTVLSAFTRISYNNVVPWGDLINVPSGLVIDGSYVHTDNNFDLTLLTKLNGIESGAEVNVQSDWDVVNPASDAFIKNKPVGLITALHRGVFYGVPDIVSGWGNDVVVNFPDVGTDEYLIVGVFISQDGSEYQNDNNITWSCKSKTSNSFHLIMREIAGSSQHLRFEFMLIPLS